MPSVFRCQFSTRARTWRNWKDNTITQTSLSFSRQPWVSSAWAGMVFLGKKTSFLKFYFPPEMYDSVSLSFILWVFFTVFLVFELFPEAGKWYMGLWWVLTDLLYWVDRKFSDRISFGVYWLWFRIYLSIYLCACLWC